MRLRNKKTGEIKSIEEIIRDAFLSNELDSLKSIDAIWEDVDDTNDTNIPLIKDERIRKAVKAWADANGVKAARYRDDNYQFIAEDTDLGSMIEFETMREKLEHEHTYTITELCGEEEECES